LPQDDGPLRIAVNGCRKTKVSFLLILYGDCSVSTPFCGGGGGGGGIFRPAAAAVVAVYFPSTAVAAVVYSPPVAAVADTYECSADMDG